MKMKFTRKRLGIGLALGGAVVLLVLWARSTGSGSLETSRTSTTPGPASPLAEPLEGKPRDGRAPGGQIAASPSAPLARTTEASAANPTVPTKVGPEGGRWEHMRYLQGIGVGLGAAGSQEAIRRTAAHLSIDTTRVPEFEQAARQSVLEMGQALEARKKELSTSGPAQGSAALVEQERLSQERYAAARAKALERLERFLGQTAIHQDFRWSFDSWASLVATRAGGDSR